MFTRQSKSEINTVINCFFTFVSESIQSNCINIHKNLHKDSGERTGEQTDPLFPLLSTFSLSERKFSESEETLCGETQTRPALLQDAPQPLLLALLFFVFFMLLGAGIRGRAPSLLVLAFLTLSLMASMSSFASVEAETKAEQVERLAGMLHSLSDLSVAGTGVYLLHFSSSKASPWEEWMLCFALLAF